MRSALRPAHIPNDPLDGVDRPTADSVTRQDAGQLQQLASISYQINLEQKWVKAAKKKGKGWLSWEKTLLMTRVEGRWAWR